MRNRTAPADPAELGGVPIVGESVWMVCFTQGHVQHLRQPFAINVGDGKPMMICGVCFRNFVGMMAARPLEPDELAEYQADQAAAERTKEGT
jgi:hypothetical protein